MPDAQKLQQILILKSGYEKCWPGNDFVYARILHRVSNLKWKINNSIATNEVLELTRHAIRINISGDKKAAPYFAVASYRNLGIYYESLDLNRQALNIYDSVILLSSHFNDTLYHHTRARYGKVMILSKIGDHQKCIDESTIGISEAIRDQNDEMAYSFANQRAQAYYYQSQFAVAKADAEFAFANATKHNDLFEIATALKTKALLSARDNKNNLASDLFRQGIAEREKTGIDVQVADDYTDYGNFFLHDEHNYKEAKKCYLKTINYSNKGKDLQRLAKAHVNLGFVSYLQNDYDEAARFYTLALQDLQVMPSDNILTNPIAEKLNLIGNKDLIFVIFGNKTELLLNLYKKINNKKYLEACLQTAMVTDSIITQTRYEQSAEQSKLYWRNRTREFFTNAVEAAYLANNAAAAFYFMEKSRAVLLNDKLNELGASVFLPPTESNKEQVLRIGILEEQQKLEALTDSAERYKYQQARLLQAKNEFEYFIKSLEKKYPTYYQYKYDDKVPSFDSLQQYLAAHQQSLVHYFMNDTVAYILCITASGNKFIKLSNEDFTAKRLQEFLLFCSDREKLNGHYAAFAALSNAMYDLLFKPFQLPKGRVIICPDNFLIPFEALCTDQAGKNFLVDDYAFSYIYSARFLMKKFLASEAKGNFVGFAPVEFNPYLKAAELSQSAISLQRCAANYTGTKLFINKNASRSNFLNAITGFSVVNIFSHANANTSGNEPYLLMQDSIIKLSELQVLENRVTSLVVLSACETNIGKSATGEGVYSLARGFSAAGIPSVAATLWNADEYATYAISEKFHEYLSKGMLKDEALQKAKSYFIRQNNKEKSLPYYWANMIIIGDTSSVKLLPADAGRAPLKWSLMIGGIILLFALTGIFIFKKTNRIGSSGIK